MEVVRDHRPRLDPLVVKSPPSSSVGSSRARLEAIDVVCGAIMIIIVSCRSFAALKQRRSDAWLSYL
jgi:hypothetical protein